jgi:tetratricopeptide (TPR) repeat protein
MLATLFVTLCLGSERPAGAQNQDNKTSEDAPPSYVPPPAWKSVEVGDYYFKRKRYNAALSRYREAVRVDPYYPPGYLGLGRVYEKIGLKQKALEAYRKYLDTLPSTKEAEDAKKVQRAIANLEHQLRARTKPRESPASANH